MPEARKIGMEDISLHILDIAENSIRARAKNIIISIEEDEENDLFSVEVKDDGSGMDEESVKKAADPFFTTKTERRIGMGIPLLAQAAEEAGGGITIESKAGAGTIIKAVFKHSHIDRRPFGNIEETLKTLFTGHPEIRFIYRHKVNEESVEIDSKELG